MPDIKIDQDNETFYVNGNRASSDDLNTAIYNYEGEDLNEVYEIANAFSSYIQYTYGEDGKIVDTLGFANQEINEIGLSKLNDYYSKVEIFKNELISAASQEVETLKLDTYTKTFYHGDSGREEVINFYTHKTKIDSLTSEINSLKTVSGKEFLSSSNSSIKNFNDNYNIEEIKDIEEWKIIFDKVETYNLDTSVPSENINKIDYLIGADGTFLGEFADCTNNTYYSNTLAS